jgi:hypothetical protein
MTYTRHDVTQIELDARRMRAEATREFFSALFARLRAALATRPAQTAQ